MSTYEEEMEYEYGAAFGDPRRCPHHPNVVTSSPDGMFDAPCGECEYAGAMGAEEERWLSRPFEFSTIYGDSTYKPFNEVCMTIPDVGNPAMNNIIHLISRETCERVYDLEADIPF